MNVNGHAQNLGIYLVPAQRPWKRKPASPISSTIRHRRFSKFDELLSRDVITDFIGKPVFGSTGVHRNFNFKPSLIL